MRSSQPCEPSPADLLARLLSDIEIASLDTLKGALTAFHDLYGIPNVIISSIPSSKLPGLPLDHLVCAGSSRLNGSADSEQFLIIFPSLPEHYEGVGDVFSSLILAHFTRPGEGPCPLSSTAEVAIASLQGILTRTRAYALSQATRDQDMSGSNPAETPEARIQRMASVELRLVQSWREIKDPKILYRAQPFGHVA